MKPSSGTLAIGDPAADCRLNVERTKGREQKKGGCKLRVAM